MIEREFDDALVKRVQAGDKSAFDLLVRKYQSRVMNAVMRIVHDLTEAEDVAQEAFIKAYRGLANFRGDSAFYTWLYRIALNTAKNHLAKGRKGSHINLDIQEVEQFDDAALLRDCDTPEAVLVTDEVRITVRKAIDALPDDLKMAITLREFEGLSYEEIATVMDCPIGTVRSRIFRAREAIDHSLKLLAGEV